MSDGNRDADDAGCPTCGGLRMHYGLCREREALKAENESLRAQLEDANETIASQDRAARDCCTALARSIKEAIGLHAQLAQARITPQGTCSLCGQSFSERHEGSVMADDHGKHCHPSCWYKRWFQEYVTLVPRLRALEEKQAAIIQNQNAHLAEQQATILGLRNELVRIRRSLPTVKEKP